MTYKETLDTLYNMMPDFQKVGAGAYKPGLERIEAFNRHLGSPDKTFCAIHVAGTNGKGSVSHMLASVLQAAGYKVGLYTSPHLRDFRERMRVDGEMVSEQFVVDFTRKHMDKMRELDLSFFEATVGMAFDWFSRGEVEVAVIETGLGGRLDATNIITPILSVITNIGMDHMAFLGDTPEAIAAEKGGIIKKDVPALIGERDPQSEPVFRDAAAKAGSKIYFAEDAYKYISSRPAPPTACGAGEGGAERRVYVVERIPCGTRAELALDLLGDYQRRNIVTAMSALELLNKQTKLSISSRAITDGLSVTALSTGLCGRWEVIGRNPLTVCDTGHNAHGLQYVVRQIAGQQYDKLYFVLGVVNDKDLGSILPLLPADAHYIFTQASVDRSLPAGELAERATARGLRGETVPTVPKAIAHARRLARPEDMIFIGGSTFVVADIEL